MSEVIYGIHAIGEALKRGGRRFDYIAVSRDRTDNRLQKIMDDCRAQGISVRFVPREDIDRETRTSRKEYTGVEELLENKNGEYSFLLVLDGVEDPHNLGALIRSADGAGVDGVVIPERRAAGVTGAVVKASAGASEHLPVARVVNIARTIDELKQQNVWVVGLDERGTSSYDEVDYKMNCAIVLGAEGKGLHDLVRRKCDMLVSIPMMGAISSLNVSVAGGIVMYEVQRQRRQAQKPVAKSAAKKKKKEE
jgi:23S rRNA (guanosine2251-2'-O)-methyltransferase